MKIYEKIHLFVQRNNNSTEIKFDLVVKMIQVHRIACIEKYLFLYHLKQGQKPAYYWTPIFISVKLSISGLRPAPHFPPYPPNHSVITSC